MEEMKLVAIEVAVSVSRHGRWCRDKIEES